MLHLVLGDDPLFHVSGYQLVHPAEFGIYAVLGIVGGLGSVAFVKLLLWLRLWFRSWPESTVWFQPVTGGLLVGGLGYFVPEVMGVGYNNVDKVLNGDVVLKLGGDVRGLEDRGDGGMLRLRERGRHLRSGVVHRSDDGGVGGQRGAHPVSPLHRRPRRVPRWSAWARPSRESSARR